MYDRAEYWYLAWQRTDRWKRGNSIIDEVWQRVKVGTMYVVVWIRHTEAVFLDFVHNEIDEVWGGVKVDTTYVDEVWQRLKVDTMYVVVWIHGVFIC